MRALFPLLLLAAPAFAGDLRTPESFDVITDPTERSAAIFEEMAKVLTHPRCMNCHPRDDRPRQGDDGHLHQPPVVRWDEGDFGPPGLHCTSCHSSEPISFVGSPGSIPGHEPWRLAPLSMGWIGLNHAEICAELKDMTRNRGRSLADIEEHHATDELVGSAWKTAGTTRTSPPGSQAQLAALTRAWVESGAACPVD